MAGVPNGTSRSARSSPRRISSSPGASYARQTAEELGIEDGFKAFLPKPNVIIDDQAPADWRRLVHVHPGRRRQRPCRSTWRRSMETRADGILQPTTTLSGRR
jgi:hypothetical protein